MVEKKSTKKKGVKAEQIQSSKAVVAPKLKQSPKLLKFNWDVAGFISAAITLVGAGILYLIGWAYLSNWYLYFGVTTEQVNTQVPQVIIFSTPTIILALALYVLVIMSVLIQPFFLHYQETPLKVLAATIPWNLTIVGHLFCIVGLTFINYYELFGSFESTLSQSPMESRYLALIAGWSLSFLVLRFILIILSSIKNKPDVSSGIQLAIIANQKLFSGINRWVWSGLIVLSYLLSLLSFSAGLGYKDAAMGIKGVSGKIQRVFFISPIPLDFIKEFEKFCNRNSSYCVYGPFGLVTENDNSFYLVEWKDNASDKIKFSRNAGVYVMPRIDQNGSYFIVPTFTIADPVNISTPTPYLIETDTPTLTALPTKPATITPSIILTSTPSFTTIPTLTP